MAEQTQPKKIKKLYGQKAEGFALEKVIKDFHAAQAQESIIGLIYSPEHCCFVLVAADGAIEAYKGRRSLTLDLSTVFEARLFTPKAELRWLKTGPDKQGKAIVLCEGEIDTLPGFEPDEQEFQQAFAPLKQTYLLWGETDPDPTPPSAGWSMLATARIGRLAIPVPQLEDSKYAVLSSCEYLDCDDNGNVFVAQERLTAVEWKTYTEQENNDG